MIARPGREPIPADPGEAMRLLASRIPFNSARLAELADRVSPLLQKPRNPEPSR
jgi:hypothetical protein